LMQCGVMDGVTTEVRVQDTRVKSFQRSAFAWIEAVVRDMMPDATRVTPMAKAAGLKLCKLFAIYQLVAENDRVVTGNTP